MTDTNRVEECQPLRGLQSDLLCNINSQSPVRLAFGVFWYGWPCHWGHQAEVGSIWTLNPEAVEQGSDILTTRVGGGVVFEKAKHLQF